MRYLVVLTVLFIAFPCHALVYLDGSTIGCSNGSTNYSPATRSCGSGSDTVSLTLSDFNTRIVAGATNYIRSGSYYRSSGQSTIGALDISQTYAGSSGNPTVIKAYTGEERQVIIGTASDRMQLNPDQSSTGSTGLTYYPNPAITVRGSYVTIDGLQTYGQVLVDDTTGGTTVYNPIIQNCDIGGGGPYSGWGHALFLGIVRNGLIANNYIHHGVATGEQNTHKALINNYASRDIVYEYNTFSDGYTGADLAIGDAQNTGGGDITIRYNFFAYNSDSNGGVQGLAQYPELDNIYIHNNVFMSKYGYSEYAYNSTDIPHTYIYNNTFANCTQGHSAWYGVPAPGTDWYNNLHYNSSGSSRYYIYSESSAPAVLVADYNMYFSTGVTSSWRWGSTNTSTWATWQGVQDAHATNGANPNFVNASGTTPADFKRSSYAENFTGSSYGIHAGAYETGSEQIGHDWNAVVASTGSLRPGVSASGVTFR